MGDSSVLRVYHTRIQAQEKENNVDPDDGNSWLCSVCTLPIFSTPFKSTTTNDGGGGGGGGGDNNKLLVHDQCAHLPKEVTNHGLHPRSPLILVENWTTSTSNSSNSCHNCKRKCGSKLYQCPDCDFQLDVLCALPITKILHRSHKHSLMAIRTTFASFTCGACGSQHRRQHQSGLSYFCHLCNFWIHSDCTLLPNAIILPHAKHQHSLFLTYYNPSRSSSAGSSKQAYTCAICGGKAKGIGVYFCGKCGYYAHINCAIMSDPQSFKPVLIRDAKFASLLHFPVADEYTSVMRYIVENTTNSIDHEVDARDERQRQSEGKLFRESLHQHPLIFQDQGGGDHQGQSFRVCNACVQPVSPPFYSCSECPNFYLHDCCANLPSKIEHLAHKQHTLFLFSKAPKSSISGCFFCEGCGCRSNGFAYSCNTCDFTMDVVCALLSPSITHESHGKTHILHMSRDDYDISSGRCHSCKCRLKGIYYECRICRHFKLDVPCALFPNAIKHKFDGHLLKLTTKPVTTDDDDDSIVSSKKVQQICEICEEDIESRKWYYSCSQCDQLFHCKCINPSVNAFFRIKFGVTIHVDCHDCPLTLIPASSIYDYQCGYCLGFFSHRSSRPAYECSKCYFRIHERCAQKCLPKS